jgi:hypothetical protein
MNPHEDVAPSSAGRSAPNRYAAKVMPESLKIRSANPTDADELLAIRRDAIMALAEEYGRVAAERWASAAHPDRAAKAIATNSVWVTELVLRSLAGSRSAARRSKACMSAPLPRAEESARRSWRTPSGRSTIPVLLSPTWTQAPMPKHSMRIAVTDRSEPSRRTIQFP